MDYSKVAADIIQNVGGKSNVQSVTHCFTRLRFVLKDDSRPTKKWWSIWKVSFPL